jgi:hypothetical protein
MNIKIQHRNEWYGGLVISIDKGTVAIANESARQDMAYQLHCMVRQQSNSDTCSEVPTNVLSVLLSADGQVIIGRTDSRLLMDIHRLNELVTKCDLQTWNDKRYITDK